MGGRPVVPLALPPFPLHLCPPYTQTRNENVHPPRRPPLRVARPLGKRRGGASRSAADLGPLALLPQARGGEGDRSGDQGGCRRRGERARGPAQRAGEGRGEEKAGFGVRRKERERERERRRRRRRQQSRLFPCFLLAHSPLSLSFSLFSPTKKTSLYSRNPISRGGERRRRAA